MSATSEQQPPTITKVPAPQPPTCCKDKMFRLMRRAILHSNGKVDFSTVWHCLMCGRLVY